MSTGAYYTCDMCGRIEMKGNAKWGWFHSGLWVDDYDRFDLCPECSVKVQNFIHGHEDEGKSDGES